MQLFRKASIKRKQMLIVMLTTSVALLLACTAFAIFEVVAFRREVVEDVSTLAETVGNNVSAALDFNDRKFVEDILGSLKAQPHVVGAVVFSKDGDVMARYDRPGDGRMMALPPRVPPVGHSFVNKDLVLAMPIVYRGETLGTIYLVSDMAALSTRLEQYAIIVVVVFLVTSLIAFLLSSKLQRVIYEPILRLVQTTRAVADCKDYSMRVAKGSPDEIGALIDGFNEMLAEIQGRDANLELRVEERTRQLQQENLERKYAEEALRESQVLYHSLVEQLPINVYRKDAEGRFVFVNARFCRVKNRTADEILGRTVQAITPSEASERNVAEHELIMQTGKTIESEEMVRHPDGSLQYFQVVKLPVFSSDGRISGTQGVQFDITQRKEAEAELEKVHRQLLETSRQAGMAEVATSVLHNVGNVLNSVNVSATLVSDALRKSKVENLRRVAVLINERSADLANFLANDSRGKQIPSYLSQLADTLINERVEVLPELESLRKNIEHIKDIVVMQQNYAKISGVVETMAITALVEDALNMNGGALARHEVEVVRDYTDVPPVTVDKHKVLQILVNLIRNAKYACDDSKRQDKQLTLRVSKAAEGIAIAVIDNGVGIPEENLTRIFNHGFTTRKEGHGFGLHSGALAAKEMGGELVALSEGPGKGATFILTLPLQSPTRPS